MKMMNFTKPAFLLAIFSALFSTQLQSVQGCGMIMHMEASNRAAQFLNRLYHNIDIRALLTKHEDAFLSGSVFPDAFYSPLCMDGFYHETAKKAHGMDYILESLNRFKTVYLNGTTISDVKGEKYLAYILGTVAHDIQDKVWHGYGIDQGFLQILSEVNFRGKFDEAHPVGDMGGDSVLLYELNFINLHLGWSQWYVPQNDIYEVMVKLQCKRPPPLCPQVGGKLEFNKAIAYCTRLTMGRGMLNKMLIHRWYVAYGMKAPMLTSPRFHDYFLGGMSDMSSWTMQRIETALRYLENPKACVRTNDNPIYWSCGDQPKFSIPPPSYFPEGWQNPSRSLEELHDEMAVKAKTNYMSKMFRTTDDFLTSDEGKEFGSDEDLVEVIEDTELEGLFLRPKGKLRKVIQAETMKELLEYGQLQRDADDNQPDQFAASSKDFYKYYVKNAYAQAGQAMISADLNKDGADDLIVGAPSFSRDNRFEEGRVFIVKASERGLPSEDVNLENASQVIRSPLIGTGRFGYSIVALDMNLDGRLDLVISAPIQTDDVVNKPYSGYVYIYYGLDNGKFADQPDASISCNMRYCNFGFQLSAGDVNRDGWKDLIIGSPYASESFEDNRQNGLVTVFFASDRASAMGHVQSYKNADVIVWGSEPYSWFGYSAMTTVSCDILIGAPGHKAPSDHAHECKPDLQMAGAVFCYMLEKKSFSVFARGHHEFEFFGNTLAEGYPQGPFGPAVLAVGASNSEDVGKLAGVLPYLNRGAGRVYLYNSFNKLPMGQLVGDRLFGGFGRVLRFHDIDRDQFDDLIVSAPLRANDVTNVLYGFAIGEMYLYYGRSDFPKSALARQCEGRYRPCTGDQADGVFGTNTRRGQFGANIAILNSVNLTQIVVAQPRTDDYAHNAGKLVLYNNCLHLM